MEHSRPTTDREAETATSSTSHIGWGIAALLALFFAFCLPLLFAPSIDVYDARDEGSYHFPTVAQFTDELPNVDLVNYPSATGPLYHLVLSLLASVTGPDIFVLRAVNLVVGLICLGLFLSFLVTRQNADPRRIIYFGTLFMLSPYVIGPAIRLSTDNAALALAIAALLLLRSPGLKVSSAVGGNILALCALLTRQLYAWLVPAFLLSVALVNRAPTLGQRLRIALVAVIPVGGLVSLVSLWHGLTPPAFRHHAEFGVNWDALVYAISVVGYLGSPLILWIASAAKQANVRKHHLLGAATIACIILLLHPVNNVYDHSTRGGTLWLIASHMPMAGETSVIFWFLFPAGAVFVVILSHYLWQQREIMLVVALPCWLVSNMANATTYQKYYEPFILLVMAAALVSVRPAGNWQWVGPSALVGAYAGIGLLRYYT